MREIKFRAWDKDENKWIDPECIYVGGNGHLLSYGRYDDIGDFDTDIDVQFFTGLKDKNGKEIYEGDIVRAIDDMKYLYFQEGYNQRWGVVEFWDVEGGYVIDDTKGNHYVRLVESGGDSEDSEFDADCLEVIGNIYENDNLK